MRIIRELEARGTRSPMVRTGSGWHPANHLLVMAVPYFPRQRRGINLRQLLSGQTAAVDRAPEEVSAAS